jgi:hypothetical protein
MNDDDYDPHYDPRYKPVFRPKVHLMGCGIAMWAAMIWVFVVAWWLIRW